MISLRMLIPALLLPLAMTAQVKFPAPSPACTVQQSIGLTEVKIEYSRPGVKDRKIFGDLVPFGEIWRTGANASTKISFDQDVNLGGQNVPAGTYALYTIPGQTEWTIILHKNLTYWGTPDNYNLEEDLCRFTVKSSPLATTVESFTIMPNNLRDNGAIISLMWENTAVHIPLELNTAKTMQTELEKALAGPDGRLYYQAARYYLDANSNTEQALEYINKAINEKGYDRFFVLRVKSLLLAQTEDYKGAIAAAELSLEKAKEEGNADYVRMNEASIKEWSAKR